MYLFRTRYNTFLQYIFYWVCYSDFQLCGYVSQYARCIWTSEHSNKKKKKKWTWVLLFGATLERNKMTQLDYVIWTVSLRTIQCPWPILCSCLHNMRSQTGTDYNSPNLMYQITSRMTPYQFHMSTGGIRLAYRTGSLGSALHSLRLSYSIFFFFLYAVGWFVHAVIELLHLVKGGTFYIA